MYVRREGGHVELELSVYLQSERISIVAGNSCSRIMCEMVEQKQHVNRESTYTDPQIARCSLRIFRDI